MNQPDVEPAGDPGSQTRPQSPGAQLLAERRSQGLSLGDIARQLKLSVRQVEALERDEYDSFPGPVFVRGFLRNYAKLLRLDPDQLVAAAGASVAPASVNAPAPVEVQVSPKNPEQRRRILTWAAVAGLAVLVLILLASNVSKEQRDTQVAREPAQVPSTAQHAESPPAISQAPAAPSTSVAAPVPPVPGAERESVAGTSPPGVAGAARVESSLDTASGSPRAASSDSPHAAISAPEETEPAAKPKILVVGSGSSQIRMIFEDEAWVEVRDGSGTTIFSRLNAPGTERVVRGIPPFAVVVGNAHRVKLMYEGKPVDLGPHTRVDVARVTLE
ncbi:MAG TPA: RodZ domain-containing protein [Burkholderiales bacterium]|nr:RodZ domain-containing protein [Burkholderiales bacterium]